MNFLIDRKFWNLVIKKLKPYHALTVKKGLVKEKYANLNINLNNIRNEYSTY